MNFRNTAHQISSLSTHIVLTFPKGFTPTNHARSREAWNKLRRWLNKRIGGIYMWEFQESGAIHMHILCNNPLDWEELSAKWFRIVGSEDKNHLAYGVRIEPIRDLNRIISYLAKIEQKDVPSDYEGMGRFWATFGRFEKIAPKVYEGRTQENLGRVRAIRRLRVSNSRRRGVRCPRDNGRYSFTLQSQNVDAIVSVLDRM
jgi:hypothetical protein